MAVSDVLNISNICWVFILLRRSCSEKTRYQDHIERLFLGYGDKWPRKWPRNGTGFAGIGMDWPGLENWMVVGSLKMLTWIGTGSAVVGMDWHSDRHRLAGVGLFYLWGKKNWYRVGERLTLELFRVAVHRPCIGWGLH